MASTYYVNSGNSVVWAPTTAYGANALVYCRIAYATTAARAFVYEADVDGGTSGGSEPTWPTTPGNTVVDNDITWTCKAITSWAYAGPFIYWALTYAATATGDVVKVHSAHNGSYANTGSFSITCGSTITNIKKVISVDKDAADALTAGAVETYTGTGAYTVTLDGSLYSYGVTYANANIASSGAFKLDTTRGIVILESNGGTVIDLTSASTQRLVITNDSTLRIINGDFKAGNIGSYIMGGSTLNPGIGYLEWFGGAVVNTVGATALFARGTTAGYHLVLDIRDVDFTGVGLGATATALLDLDGAAGLDAILTRCKLPTDAGFTVTVGTVATTDPSVHYKLHHCSGANNTYDFYEETSFGTSQDEITIVRTSGAVHGATAISYKLISKSTSQDNYIAHPSPPIESYTASATEKTFTVEGVYDSLTNLQNDEVWMTFEYPANGTDGLGAVATTKCAILGTPADLATSSVAWTTTGITNVNKFKFAVTVTPGKAGPITARIYVAKPSTTIYIDPVITEA